MALIGGTREVFREVSCKYPRRVMSHAYLKWTLLYGHSSEREVKVQVVYCLFMERIKLKDEHDATSEALQNEIANALSHELELLYQVLIHLSKV